MSNTDYIVAWPCGYVNINGNEDRVKFFWEKSSAGIEWPEFGASFEQGCRAGELAAGQAGILVLEDTPIVISAEGFRNLLFSVFVVYLKSVSQGVVILCAFLSVP